jgi:hypothetical protein
MVYQAYRPSIGRSAARNGYFGGEFKLTRMTWIKTSFLWMMHRSRWGESNGQETVLAVRLKRAAFDQILRLAVHSTFRSNVYPNRGAWKAELAAADVRLQWDPDYDPWGTRVKRRAIQLGLSGDSIIRFSEEWILDIQDISSFVKEQSRHAQRGDKEQLLTPREQVYPIADRATARRLELSIESDEAS